MNTGTSELGQRVSWWTDRRRAIITDPRSTASTPSLICYGRLRDESGILHSSPPLGTLSLKLVYYHVAGLCDRAAPRFFGSWRLDRLPSHSVELVSIVLWGRSVDVSPRLSCRWYALTGAVQRFESSKLTWQHKYYLLHELATRSGRLGMGEVMESLTATKRAEDDGAQKRCWKERGSR